jgi:hypothetical protein
MEEWIHVFLTSTLVGEWSASSPGSFTPGEEPSGTYWIGGWVGPGAVMDRLDVKRKFLTVPGLELRPLGRPTRSQSVQQLRYPGSLNNK